MEEKEKYGVELEAETSGFKRQMQDLIKTTEKTGEEIKSNLKITPEIDEKTKAKIQQLNDKINFYSSQKKLSEFNKQKLEEYKNELDQLTNSMKNLDSGTNVMKEMEETTKKLGKSIKESLNVKDSINFNELEAKINNYNKQIKDLTKELDVLLIKQRNDEWGGKSDTFNEDIEITKNKIETLGNSIDKINVKKIEILDYDHITQYITELEQRLKQLKSELEQKKKASIWSVEQGEIEALNESIRQTSVELDLAKDRFAKLEDINLNQAKDEIEDTTDELSRFQIMVNQIKSGFSNMGDTISKGFEKTKRSIKRLTLSLVGVHSAYFVISKAVSNYSQYDVEYTKKMKSAWASLGAFLAPLTSMLGTLMQKLVGYFNVFVKALTGVDFIQKANDAYKYSQSIKQMEKNAKSATKSLTAMDEITNIEDPDDVGGTGLDDFNPFETIQNVELDPEWVARIKELGEKLQPVYKMIKDIVNWCLEHPEVIAGLIGGTALLKLLAKVIGFAGTGTAVGTGLAGVLGVLLAIAGLAVITISIYYVVKNAKEATEANKTVIKQADKLAKKFQKAREEYEKYIKTLKKNSPEANELFDKSIKKVQKLKDELKQLNEEKEKSLKPDSAYEGATIGSAFRQIWYLLGGDKKRQESMFYTDIQESYTYLNNLKKLYDQGKLNDEQTKQYKIALQEFTTELDKAGYGASNVTKEFSLNKDRTKEVSDMYNTAKTSLDKFGDETTTTSDKVKTNSDKMKKNIKGVKDEVDKVPTKKEIELKAKTKNAIDNLKKVGELIGTLFSFNGTGAMIKFINAIRSYDVGTPYVPEDGLAMIHKGERIIPAKFNNENLFNGSNNETTNALLVELIQAVEENGDKVPVFNINGKEFAKATINDYRDEENRLNKNTIIRRV